MFKRLGRMLKRGAMSVEYIVIGVCVIGMAALATTFVSGKMTEAMGKEIDSGGTNAGGQDSNNGSNSNLSTCDTNKFFYDKYGLYPGTYNAYFAIDTSVNLNSFNNYNKVICTIDTNEIFRIKNSTDDGTLGIFNLNTNVCSYESEEINSIYKISKFTNNYSEESLNKIIVFDCENENTDKFAMKILLPKNAFKLNGHSDCSGFNVEEKDFLSVHGIKESEVSNDMQSRKVENKKMYWSYKVSQCVVDFETATVSYLSPSNIVGTYEILYVKRTTESNFVIYSLCANGTTTFISFLTDSNGNVTL